jgi:hypothetical protein
MNNIHFKFNSEDSSSQNSHLSIEVSNTHVNLALLNLDTNTYFGIECVDFKNNFIANSELLKQVTPKTISCSFNNLAFSLVPLALFDETNLDAYLKLNGDKENDKLLYSISNKKEVVSCYKTTEELSNYILRSFPNALFYHFSTVFIDSIRQGVHINFSSDKTFECAFVNEKGLLFYNGYEYRSPEETLYFLSLICDKFELDVQKIKISVSGNLTNNIAELWDNYIPKSNLQYKNTIEYYSFSTSLKSIDKHKYFSLLKQYTCV